MDEAVADAPGRVVLLGELTDYSGGLVLPLAIHRVTRVRARRREDGWLEARSNAFAHLARAPAAAPWTEGWAACLGGVLAEIRERADLSSGVRLDVAGDLPVGAGLASSAALTVATARALDELFGLGLPDRELAFLCQRAEHRAGVRCGIMDPMTAAASTPGCALLLDCHALEARPVRMPPVEVLVAHTGIRHELARSAYNARVDECKAAAAHRPSRPCLGRWRMDDWVAARLPPVLGYRARHVIEENERVRQGVAALEAGDLAEFGRLMLASHESLRRRFEVSCPELDRLVERLAPVAWGAKMTGAGFGGAVVALVPPERAGEALARVADSPLAFVARPWAG